MKNSEVEQAIHTLRSRYQVDIDSTDWESLTVHGGVAMDADALHSLQSAASNYDDHSVDVYEVESTQGEFPPIRVDLTDTGMQQIRDNLMSHFDLVLLPDSRRWVAFLSSELVGEICGPKEFIDSIAVRLEIKGAGG